MATQLDELLGYGRDFAQGASNAVAGNVSAPVDGIAWLLRKAGLDVGEPVGGSDWMARKGLTAQPKNALAGLLGESAGMVAPMLAAAKGPQIANALNRMVDNAAARPTLNPQAGAVLVPGVEGATAAELLTAQRNAALPVEAGGLGLPAGNTASQRMGAMKMEPGWFRGGSAPVNGAPTGPWYTQISDEAADYASRTPAALRDVREYALANSGRLKFDGGYPTRLATDLAAELDAAGHAKAAQTLRDYYADGSPISGMAAYRFLEKNVGDAEPFLSKLGFKSVEGVNSPNYRKVMDDTTVRDAKRAAFDPKRRAERNIFASAAGATPLAALLYGNQDPGN